MDEKKKSFASTTTDRLTRVADGTWDGRHPERDDQCFDVTIIIITIIIIIIIIIITIIIIIIIIINIIIIIIIY